MIALEKFAFDHNDDAEIRQEKVAALLIAGSCCIAGCIWTLMYYFIFGLGLTTLLPLCFVVIVGIFIIISHYQRNHFWAVYAQIICIIYITTFIQWSIGGVFDSGFVMAWAFCGPITALMFLTLRQSIFWLFMYIINIAITVFFNDLFIANGQIVEAGTKLLFFVMNLSVSSLVVFVFAYFFVSNALNEREKANQLLLNILPKPIAAILKNRQGIIADGHEEVSVLFADIVGFTKYSSSSPPDEVVASLDKIFNEFDELTSKYGLEKIKTIGDAYMVASGVPVPNPNHAKYIALLAIDMLLAIEKMRRNGTSIFSLRIGIHSGPVVAGVIGKSKFAYDLWGDTVNVASRMESNGKPGVIQVSKKTYLLLKNEFELSSEGTLTIKGKGEMEIFYLLRQKNTTPNIKG
ncbi:MAG: adenylate/guanylate cyclase domain-containing protein [Bacteroidetes bacterium]|jgi:guanylate cyclase|nr:adenylate/guanylate cyclase domain-containing protein [Bacteroidota bacterium]